jgi:hypothetical protein
MNARAALNLTMFFSSASPSAYYLYRNSKGELIISNQKPPSGSKIIKPQSFSNSGARAIAVPERKALQSNGSNRNSKSSHKD